MNNKYYELVNNKGELIMDSQHRDWILFYQLSNGLKDSTSIKEYVLNL